MDSHQAHDDRKFFVDYRGEADGMASGAEFAGAPLHGTGSRSAHTSSRGSAANGAVAINTAATSTSGRNVPGQLTAQAPELAQQVNSVGHLHLRQPPCSSRRSSGSGSIHRNISAVTSLVHSQSASPRLTPNRRLTACVGVCPSRSGCRCC